MIGIYLLVTLLTVHMMYAAAFPSRAEVDLVFPRKETYAPTALFPIVFAFQNPKLVAAMDPNIYVTLYTGIHPNITIIHTSLDGQVDGMNLYYTNFSSSDPVYVYLYTTALNKSYDQGTLYHLEWKFSGGNCSTNNSTEEFADVSVQLEHRYFSNTLDFTIQNGAQQPDMASPSKGSLCNSAKYFAFNVTSTIDFSGSDYLTEEWTGRKSCAVLSDVKPRISGNPCAIKVSNATASSISAAITATVCASAWPTPAISCPTSKNSSPLMFIWNTPLFFGWLAIASLTFVKYI